MNIARNIRQALSPLNEFEAFGSIKGEWQEIKSDDGTFRIRSKGGRVLTGEKARSILAKQKEQAAQTPGVATEAPPTDLQDLDLKERTEKRAASVHPLRKALEESFQNYNHNPQLLGEAIDSVVRNPADYGLSSQDASQLQLSFDAMEWGRKTQRISSGAGIVLRDMSVEDKIDLLVRSSSVSEGGISGRWEFIKKELESRHTTPKPTVAVKADHELTIDEYQRKHGMNFDLASRGRKQAIEQALKKGKTVPPEVLADYPDLAAKLTPTPPVPKSAEPKFKPRDISIEGRDLIRTIAFELAAAYRSVESIPAAVVQIERVLNNSPGIDRVSEKGELVPFNPFLHEAGDGDPPKKGEMVYVYRSGWRLEKDQADNPGGKVLIKAKVGRQSSQSHSESFEEFASIRGEWQEEKSDDGTFRIRSKGGRVLTGDRARTILEKQKEQANKTKAKATSAKAGPGSSQRQPWEKTRAEYASDDYIPASVINGKTPHEHLTEGTFDLVTRIVNKVGDEKEFRFAKQPAILAEVRRRVAEEQKKFLSRLNDPAVTSKMSRRSVEFQKAVLNAGISRALAELEAHHQQGGSIGEWPSRSSRSTKRGELTPRQKAIEEVAAKLAIVFPASGVDAEDAHKQEILNAMKAGRPVPAHVLDEYPKIRDWYAANGNKQPETHSERFAEPRQTALAGDDGEDVERLLSEANSRGRSLFTHLTARAVRRLLQSPRPLASQSFFDDEEFQALADAFAATRATSHLLGATRAREMADEPITGPGRFQSFADQPSIEPMRPAKALDYFRGLTPELGVRPRQFERSIQRRAFTVAAATDRGVLDRIKKVILDRMQEGRMDGLDAGPQDIDDILEAAGISPRNPQYAEMVWRTNVQDAYNFGQWSELQSPEMSEAFPVWQYIGIRDGRQGEDHEPNFGRFFSSAVPFAEVRGPRVFNCRCSFRPVSKMEWGRLARQGVKMQSEW